MRLKTIHGFNLIIDPSIDKGVELTLFRRGTYEEGILDFLGKNFKGQGAFVDVGANIGLMSIYMASKFPKSAVHAFEAHPMTMEIFKENLAINHIGHVSPYAFALGSEEGKAMIYTDHELNRGGASMVAGDQVGDSFEISVRKLDNLELSRIEVIKLDVEGYELEVLKGAEQTIQRDQPTLIIEVSAGRGSERVLAHEIFDFVQALGSYKMYKLKGSKERRSTLVEVLSYADLPAHDNLVCLSAN